MEHLEVQKKHGGPGAYDVLRCDLIQKRGADKTFKVWGQDYHLNRLEMSYRELVKMLLTPKGNEKRNANENAMQNTDSFDDRYLEIANKQSDAIITSLLSKMVEQSDLGHSTEAHEHDLVCEIIRVTLLWTPSFDPADKDPSSGSQNIIVRGHASTSGQIWVPDQIPTAIVATLALPNHSPGTTSMEEFPGRHISPHAKISSWSRNRRPLEKKEGFMPDGVGEVLLLQGTKSELTLTFEILEGMTSNFFAVYRDGTIRTAQYGVLFGYIRHLVLECASSCGLIVDNRPVRLEDGANGLWAETFITSSSRLIYPIEKILIPDYEEVREEQEGLNWKPYWQVESKDTQDYKWHALLREILKRGGY